MPEFGDCIGVESGADLKSDVADAQPRQWGRISHRSRRSDAAAKEYPPPISWLARTENQSSHMPWVMKKYYSGDGRLIIKEEKVKHHEYFLADRSNGRLVLNLINLDDACKECHDPKEEIAVNGSNSGDEINGQDDEIDDPTKVPSECYRYIGMGVNPCGGLVATAAAAAMFRPPVHT